LGKDAIYRLVRATPGMSAIEECHGVQTPLLHPQSFLLPLPSVSEDAPLLNLLWLCTGDGAASPSQHRSPHTQPSRTYRSERHRSSEEGLFSLHLDVDSTGMTCYRAFLGKGTDTSPTDESFPPKVSHPLEALYPSYHKQEQFMPILPSDLSDSCAFGHDRRDGSPLCQTLALVRNSGQEY
jgi:hypothetical protein